MKRSHSWILISLLLVSCGGGDDGAGPGDGGNNDDLPEAVPTAAGTPDGTPTSETIGAGGGSVASSDGLFALDIPAGALASDTEITIQPITNTAWGGRGAGYRLTPDGLTFAQPVTLTFNIAPETLEGTVGDALDVAFQDDAGFWFLIKNGTYDENTGTLSCTTTHFTDFTAIEEYLLKPTSAGLGPSSSVELDVIKCIYATVAEDEDAIMQVLTCTEDDENLAPLINATNWSVNGVRGGNNTVGRIVELAQGQARYTAPVAVPIVNPVAASVQVRLRRGSSTYLVSNITISNSFTGTISYSGADNGTDTPEKINITVTWTSEGSIGSYETFYGEGTLTYTMPDQVDCPSETMTPNSGPLDPENTTMTINRYVDPPLIIVQCVAEWDGEQCFQCQTDPEYCVEGIYGGGFTDNLATLSTDGNTITGYGLNLDTGEYWNYQFTRPAPPAQ
jgi:hypothetical protein